MAIKIKIIDGNHAIAEDGTRFLIRDDSRGMDKKMWINKEDGGFLDSYLIKFATRTKRAIGQFNLYNEVLCSRLCSELGLNHVDYNLCEVEMSDGSVKNGVICQTYKKTPNKREVNGKTLYIDYCQAWYDNNFGQIPKIELNTTHAYLDQLKTRFVSRKMIMSPETESRLDLELFVLAVFDYATCQIDRHWGNVGWLHNNIFEDSDFKIELLPIYDNECAFLLDDMTEEVYGKIVGQINDKKRKNVVVDMINRKKNHSPCLGIQTSLVRIKEGTQDFLLPLPNDAEGLSNAMILAREIAEESLVDPKKGLFCERLMSFDMHAFLEKCDFISKEHEDVKQIYEFVWNTRMKLLKDSFEHVKNTYRGDGKDATDLSLLQRT